MQWSSFVAALITADLDVPVLQLPAADLCLPQEWRGGEIFRPVNEFLRYREIWDFSDLGDQCIIIRQIGINQYPVPH